MACLYAVTSKYFSGFKNLICTSNNTSENFCASTLKCSIGLQQEQQELKKHWKKKLGNSFETNLSFSLLITEAF